MRARARPLVGYSLRNEMTFEGLARVRNSVVLEQWAKAFQVVHEARVRGAPERLIARRRPR
jgi:hypothetical protein